MGWECICCADGDRSQPLTLTQAFPRLCHCSGCQGLDSLCNAVLASSRPPGELALSPPSTFPSAHTRGNWSTANIGWLWTMCLDLPAFGSMGQGKGAAASPKHATWVFHRIAVAVEMPFPWSAIHSLYPVGAATPWQLHGKQGDKFGSRGVPRRGPSSRRTQGRAQTGSREGGSERMTLNPRWVAWVATLKQMGQPHDSQSTFKTESLRDLYLVVHSSKYETQSGPAWPGPVSWRQPGC